MLVNLAKKVKASDIVITCIHLDPKGYYKVAKYCRLLSKISYIINITNSPTHLEYFCDWQIIQSVGFQNSPEPNSGPKQEQD